MPTAMRTSTGAARAREGGLLARANGPQLGARRRRDARAAGIERLCVALCHDLRGPLATAGAALERLAVDERGGELLSIAHRSLAQAEELLASLPGLLACERAPRLAPVALADVVAAAHDDVRVELHLAGGSVAIETPLPVVLGHAERLRIAVRNLLRNAIRHRRGDVPLAIRVRACGEDGHAAIHVADNGVGVAPRDRRRVFAPLERGSGARGGGSGLGLAIARSAVAACAGSLALCERDGPGACFAIRLRATGSGGAASRP
jgi:signal transduction histidine kinase